MKHVCVYCGSSEGLDPAYAQAACHLGRTIASQGLVLVYGGARVGLMGHLARAALAAGGEVLGVMPRHLVDLDLAQKGLSELRIVDNMHERKAAMALAADAFIALPGGMGTLEELLETLTWAQLGLHQKPCGLLNTRHYYDPLISLLAHAEQQGFLHPRHRALLLQAHEPEPLLHALNTFRMPLQDKASWILGMTQTRA